MASALGSGSANQEYEGPSSIGSIGTEVSRAGIRDERSGRGELVGKGDEKPRGGSLGGREENSGRSESLCEGDENSGKNVSLEGYIKSNSIPMSVVMGAGAEMVAGAGPRVAVGHGSVGRNGREYEQAGEEEHACGRA